MSFYLTGTAHCPPPRPRSPKLHLNRSVCLSVHSPFHHSLKKKKKKTKYAFSLQPSMCPLSRLNFKAACVLETVSCSGSGSSQQRFNWTAVRGRSTRPESGAGHLSGTAPSSAALRTLLRYPRTPNGARRRSAKLCTHPGQGLQPAGGLCFRTSQPRQE